MIRRARGGVAGDRIARGRRGEKVEVGAGLVGQVTPAAKNPVVDVGTTLTPGGNTTGEPIGVQRAPAPVLPGVSAITTRRYR